MCAEYSIITSDRDLEALLGRELTFETDSPAWELQPRLYSRAPIIRSALDGTLLVPEATFSLLPPGGRVPFTANTRLDDWDDRLKRVVYAYQRPTWRDAFLQHRCVIPVSEFMEPIYDGEFAGRMVGFSDARDRLSLIAGIYKETIDPVTGELFVGFSMMTDYAHPTVRSKGHHRTVILLEPADALRWIKPEPITGAAGVEFLVKRAAKPELNVRVVREMKNWRARVKNSMRKAREEFRTEALVREKRGR